MATEVRTRGTGVESHEPALTRLSWQTHSVLRRRGLIWGGTGAGLLILAYVLVLAAANSLEHALDEFLLLWYWMVPLIIGFGIQTGLFAYLRGAPVRHRLETHGLAASGSVNTLAMVACCAHHLTDVLPLVGLAGAALILSSYQSLFLLVGVLSSLVGTTYMLGTFRKHAVLPPERAILGLVVRFPFDRAIPAAIAISVLVLVIVTALSLF